MKLTEKEKQLVLTALDKHEASIKRLKGATQNIAIAELYGKEQTEVQQLKTKITTGQGALTL